MRKIYHVAVREFLATVATKGFVFGLLITPTLIVGVAFLIPRLMKEEAPRVEGQVAVLDPTGEIVAPLTEYLKPEEIAGRRKDMRDVVARQVPGELRALGGAAAEAAQGRALQALLGEVPHLEVAPLPAGANLEKEKELLKESAQGPPHRLALVAIHPDAVASRTEPATYGSYDLFVRAKLDDRIQKQIRDGLRESIISARVRAAGLDRGRIESLTRVAEIAPITVTEKGEQKVHHVFNLLLPAGFMILLLMSVMTGGQYLLTSTVEEKSSRVVEVLLSAVSPLQLMTGKILGQLAVGFVILAVYAGLGVGALATFALLGFIDPWLFLYLILFFLIAYFILGSLMAAVGAAVNEMREAQSLMTPIMLTMMIPWFLWMPISRDPNSLFAVIISLTPPVNSFAMLLRLTSTSPPPAWQVWLSILIGVGTVYAVLWFAGKVFRIGLLMYGKPPNFATLVRWVRMA